MEPNKGVIIVTGSSRGIGKETARQLLALGFTVVVNGRNPDRLQATYKELQSASQKLLSVACDVSTAEGANTLINLTIEAFGRVDGLVNNVGVSSRGMLADVSPLVVKMVFESNVYGVVFPTQRALPYLRRSKGSVIFISSLAGIHGLPGLSPYCASKMALRAFAESIRIEEHKYGVHSGIVLVGKTAVEPDKEVYDEQGSKRHLAPREGTRIQSMEEVATGIIRALLKRKDRVIMTRLGKLQSLMQRVAPKLLEKIIVRNIHRFEEENK